MTVCVAAAATVLVSVGTLTVPAASGALPRASGPKGGPPIRDGAVLMAFDSTVSRSRQRALLTSVDAKPVRSFDDGALLLSVRTGAVGTVVRALKADPMVRYAEPDYRSEQAATPNDPSFPSQWALRNTGQTVNGVTGTAGADENAVAAWKVSTGSRSVVIGEVDTGVDYSHPDLAANVWTNPGGINGCAAGTHGYNVLTSACDPMDDDTQYGGHGTHVAGIMGAVGNNGTGVTGLNWSTTILPVKWVDSNGAGYTSDLLSALDWLLSAKKAGVDVRVVNDSDVFYGTAYSQALSDEIGLLGQNGILFVTAAGNTSDDNDNPSVRRYPCGYDLSNEICVAGTDQNDDLASWSNYGMSSVDLAAPGDNVYSTLRGGSYGFISGTSMAAPQVSGTAALILSTNAALSPLQLKARILESVDTLPSLTGPVRTGGRLDTCRALAGCGGVSVGPNPFSITPPPVTTGGSGPAPQEGTPVTAGTGDWDLSPSSFSYAWQRCSSTGASCTGIAGATSSAYTPTAADVGSTLVAVVTATNGSGSTAAPSVPTQVVEAAGGGGSGSTTTSTSTSTSTTTTTTVQPTTTTTTVPPTTTTTTTTVPPTTTTTVPPTTTTTVPPTTTTTTTVPPTTTTTVAPTTTADDCAFQGPTSGISAVEIGQGDGYFVASSVGQVCARGSAVWQGDLRGVRLAAPVVAIEATADGLGYWLLGADGGIFAFGDARFHGSTADFRLNAPVVGMAVTPDGAGYWIVAKDGGIFSFGDARFHGSTGNIRLSQPVDGIAVAPGGNGYWLVAADGGVFTFTPDGFFGSLGGVRLAGPVVGMSSTRDGRGYTLVGADGGVFSFGDASFTGSLAGHPPSQPIVDLSPAPHNDGYYLVTESGTVYALGPGTRFEGDG